MRGLSQKNWFSGLLALLFALLLFFNANAQGSISNITGNTQIYDETIYNVPVQLEYDQDKYFVSGYEETVDVQLSSANRIQLDKEANEDTRNFQVVADLTNTPLGTSEIQLKVKGLSTAVTASVEPKTITATIEKKVSKKFKVEALLPDSLEQEGYEIDTTSIEPKEVEVTTGEETLKAIDRVVAPLSNVKQSVTTINQTVNVQALDSSGQVLSIENPAPQVNVTIDLTLPSKKVSLKAVSSGSSATGISNFYFSLSTSEVEISGPNSVINAIDVLEVPVDITNVQSTTKQTVKIPTNEEYIVKPSDVDVTITPSLVDNTTTSYGSGGASTGSSYSSSSGSQVSSGTIDSSSSDSSGGSISNTSTEKKEESLESEKSKLTE